MIGPLFPAQSITGLIGLGVVAVRRLWAAVVGAAIAGFLLSVARGRCLKDSWLAAFAKEAFTVEILAAAC